MTTRIPTAWRGRLTLILLALIFAAPMGAAWFVFHYTDIGKGVGAHPNGELIQPARPLPDALLFNPVTGARSAHLKGKWTLMYLGGPACTAACRDHLYTLRQLRLAMGRDGDRVQRLLAIYGGPLPRYAGDLQDQYAGQLLVEATALDPGGRGEVFRVPGIEDPLGADRLYIVDPLGNLMMSYPAGASPDGIIKDLKRLLQVSRIG